MMISGDERQNKYEIYVSLPFGYEKQIQLTRQFIVRMEMRHLG